MVICIYIINCFEKIHRKVKYLMLVDVCRYLNKYLNLNKNHKYLLLDQIYV